MTESLKDQQKTFSLPVTQLTHTKNLKDSLRQVRAHLVTSTIWRESLFRDIYGTRALIVQSHDDRGVCDLIVKGM